MSLYFGGLAPKISLRETASILLKMVPKPFLTNPCFDCDHRFESVLLFWLWHSGQVLAWRWAVTRSSSATSGKGSTKKQSDARVKN